MEKVKKKLLIVVNYYYPYISGVSEYAKYVAKSLSDNFDVTVLTGQHNSELKVKELIDGYQVYRAKPLFFLNKGYISLEFITLFRTLAKEADIINIHFPMLESGLLSLLTKKPILLKYHCDMALTGNLVDKFAVTCVRISGKYILHKSKKIVVSSNDYASHSSYLTPHINKCVQIYPPNRFEDFDKGYDLLPIKNGGGCKIVGFVGRFVKEKGIDVLLEATKKFKGENIIFWIAGDFNKIAGGSIYDEIRHGIEALGEQVVILGSLSDQQLASFYSSIDILVLPSLNPFEAFGMVQLEAMSYGSIPVTSDLPGVREVVKRTGIGYLVEPGSVDSLHDAIRSALLDCVKLDRKHIKETAKGIFYNAQFVDRYLSLVNTLAK